MLFPQNEIWKSLVNTYITSHASGKVKERVHFNYIYIYIKTIVPDLYLMVSNHLDVVKVLKYETRFSSVIFGLKRDLRSALHLWCS